MTNPKFSIIISVYNVKNYVKETLDSVINQTLSDIEIICINDGSTDNSGEILNEYAKKDSRIKIIDQENQGLASSRNNALKIATGEYFLCVDSDDYIRKDSLELLYNKAKKCNLDMLSFSGTNFDDKTRKDLGNPYWEFQYLPTHFNTDNFTYKYCTSFITEMAVSSCLTTYRLDFIKKNRIEFPAGLCFEDNVFFCKALMNAKSCGILNEKLYYRRVHDASITQNWEKYFADYIKISDRVLTYLRNINIEFSIYIKYKNHYLISCINRYNSYSNKYRALYYEDLKSLLEKYDRKLISCILKPLKPFELIFSAKNNLLNCRKIITICGITIKSKSSKLKEKKRIFELEKRYQDLEEKIIENQKNNNKKLSEIQQKIRKYCAPEMRPIALADWYYERTGKVLDLDNPQTFNEKIQWMKLYDSTPIKTRLADKYLVREWVKEKIGEEYLIPLLGVWDNFDEIDFDKLPNQFVLKCNHGCGYNIIVKDKTNFDICEARKKINSWMGEDFAFKGGFEMHYSDIPRKIIAEKYIENSNNDLYDYKVWCFNGKAQYVQFLSERNTDGLKMAFYDRNWNKQDFVYSYPLDIKENPKPKNIDILLKLAEKLSESFSHVRVDFYITNDGQIYFGEMTFTSCSGMSNWQPKSTDLMLGQMIELREDR